MRLRTAVVLALILPFVACWPCPTPTPCPPTPAPTTPSYCGPGSFSSACCPGFNKPGQTATALADGRALIVASRQPGAGPAVAFAETFDPATRRFLGTTTDPTAIYDFHSATRLSNGKVLVAGKVAGSNLNARGKLETFDPATGSFTALAASFGAMHSHTGTALAGAKALLAGGNYYGGTHPVTLAKAWVFDDATSALTETGSMTNPRVRHAAVGLANGKVLIVGGRNDSPGPQIGVLESAEIFDPAAGAFAATGAMSTKRAQPTAVLLASGKVLVLGGSDAANAPLATAEIFDPATGTFAATGSMAAPRAGATATLVAGGKVLVVGGDAAAGPGTEIFDPATGTFCAGAPLRWGRRGHSAAALPNDQVLIVGGAPEACAEIYGSSSVSCGAPPSVTFTQVQSINPAQPPPLRRNADAEALISVTSQNPAPLPRFVCVIAQAEGACGQAEILDCNTPSAIKVLFRVGPTAAGTCRLRFVARDAGCGLGIGIAEVPVQ